MQIKKISAVFWLLGFWLFVTGGGFGQGALGLVKYFVLGVLVVLSLRVFLLNIEKAVVALALIFSYMLSHYLARGKLASNDVLVLFYALFFLIIYRRAKTLVIQPNYLAAVVFIQFFVNLIAYTDWQIANSAIRFKLAFMEEAIDPNLSAICFVFASIAVASIADSKVMKTILAIAAVATCLVFESRSAILLLLVYAVICAYQKRLLVRSALTLAVLVIVPLLLSTAAGFFDLKLPPRIVNVVERFKPENVKSEEGAEGARFEIYGDIARCMESTESIYNGCQMGVQENPHNEFVRGYVDAGFAGLLVFFIAVWASFYVARHRNRNLLMAGYVPMFFYGFTFYLFAPLFFTMLFIRGKTSNDI
ncbi:MAG: hypothetical protein ACOYBR_07065 [Fluviibacter sp.]